MFMNAGEIAVSTGWLLENASPSVRYLAHRHILRADPQSEPMLALWEEVCRGSDAGEILSRQNEDGSWFSGGPWGPQGYRRQGGYTPSRPKFVTTAWLLPFLGEMGFTAQDERVGKGCQYILQHLDYDGPIPDAPPEANNCCGLFAIPLWALASVGLGGDGRLRGGWERLLARQRADGGWLNPNHLVDAHSPSRTRGRWPWDRSCAWGSFFAAQALYCAGDAFQQPALPAALQFLLWHLSQHDPAQIQTWVYHGHNTVRELLMWSKAGFDMSAPPIQALLDWLRGYYRPEEGVFRTQDRPISDFVRHISAIGRDFEGRYGAGYWERTAKVGAPVLRYHLYHLVEDDWLTYYLTRIAVNMAAALPSDHPAD